MKVSVDWLKEYVDFEGNPRDLIDSLPMLGLEVEETGGANVIFSKKLEKSVKMSKF